MKIAYHPKFIRQYNKFPEDLKIEIKEKIALFEQNSLHPSLKNHKLHGRLREFSSFSVNYAYRILYIIKDNIVILSKIGTHDMYK